MKLDPQQWAENIYDWFEYRIELVLKKKTQIFQIIAAILIFTICAGSLQYIPFFVKLFHISDMAFGRMLVYSLPFWIAFAIFLIWRS